MGRVFVLEFDDLDTNKFYLCKVCRTPLARNTDASGCSYMEGVWVDQYVSTSIMSSLFNVVISGIVQETRTNYSYSCSRYINCIMCNNKVGTRFDYRRGEITTNTNFLSSRKVLFLKAGRVYLPDMVDPEDWFNTAFLIED